MGPNESAHTDCPPASDRAWPSLDAPTLGRIDALLRAGKAGEAIHLAPGSGSPWVRNARGVCLLRLDRAGEAVHLLRDLVFEPGQLAPRSDAEPRFQVNFALALLLDGNAEGFWGIVTSIRDCTDPAVVQLDAAIRRWKAGLTAWQRVRTALGGGPPFVPDFPPGVV